MTREEFRAKVRAKQIQQMCVERDITWLTHFTRIENLNEILKGGLLSRKQLASDGRDFHFNDSYRVDTHTDAICLNVSFPNYRLFYRFRKSIASEVDESHWVVFLLDVKIMWELDCAFCDENAAANRVSRIPLENRKESRALEGLFEEEIHFDTRAISRQLLAISKNYTTNPQAEILVFDQIAPEYIKKVVFYNHIVLRRWQSSNLATNTQKSSVVDDFYFAPRADYLHWRFDTSEAYDSDEPKPNVEDDTTFDDDERPF